MLKDKLISLIESKGWLALDSLFFDNCFHSRIINTSGYVALDKTNGIYYTMSTTDLLDSSSIAKVVCDLGNDVGGNRVVVCQDIDSLQRFQMALFAKYKDPDKKAQVPTPNIPKTVDDTTQTVLLADKFDAEKDVKAIKVYDDKERYILFDGAKEFQVNQAKFKAFLVSYLGCTLTDLI